MMVGTEGYAIATLFYYIQMKFEKINNSFNFKFEIVQNKIFHR